jgi:hypothetical protein
MSFILRSKITNQIITISTARQRGLDKSVLDVRSLDRALNLNTYRKITLGTLKSYLNSGRDANGDRFTTRSFVLDDRFELDGNNNAIRVSLSKSMFRLSTSEVIRLKGAIVGEKFEFRAKNDNRLPSSMKKLYQAIKAHIEDSRRTTRVRGGLLARALMKFENDEGEVFIRTVNLVSFRQFELEVNRFLRGENSQIGSDNDELMNTALVFSQFGIFITRRDNAGGAKNPTMKSKWFNLCNVRSSGNNCLIECMRKKYVNVAETKSTKIRKRIQQEYNIAKNSMIRIEDIHLIEQFFGVNIDVWTEDETETIQLYTSEELHNQKIDLFLLNEHYCIINSMKQKLLKPDLKLLYLFFDLETVYDKSRLYKLTPYSSSWYIHDPNDEFVYSEEVLNNCQFRYGDNCVKDLVEVIKSCPEGYTYKIIGFNNSRFDNFFLAEESSNDGGLGFLFYVNNSILNMKINKHTTFDLCRFLNTSLANACDSFKSNPVKLEGFNHTIPQQAFEDGELDKWIQDNFELIRKYNKIDVLALCDLTMKFRGEINELIEGDLTDYMTIGQMSYDIFNKGKTVDIPPPLNYTDDLFIRRALTAGRTQSFHGKLNMRGDFRMVDVTSLYPFVMKAFSYPINEYTKTDVYVEDKLGIYSCRIVHQNLQWVNRDKIVFPEGLETEYAPTVIPLRVEDKPLNWTYRGEQYCNLTTIDIDSIRKYGGEVEVFEGIYWEDSSNEVFNNYIEPFMNMKNEQDVFKNDNSDSYNPALREVCKLFLNSLSGKVIQRNFNTTSKCIFGNYRDALEQYDEFVDKIEPDSLTIDKYGKLLFLAGTFKDETDIYKSSAKPSYLGVFIYSYARRYMYDTLLSRYCVLYEDTDSAAMSLVEYNRLEEEQGNLFGAKKFGNLDEEVGDATRIITIAPKCYMVHNPTDEDKCKLKFKGVKIKTDTYSVIEDGQFILNDGSRISINGLTSEIIRDKLNTEKKCRTIEMFEDIYNGKDIGIFSSQLVKTRVNRMGESSLDVSQRFLVKIIKNDKKKDIGVRKKHKPITKIDRLLNWSDVLDCED